ncbi:Lrp/AsnC family transcriptional regulator [Macrococcus equi]|uniref:Lrp/AsnC family transcriptional regulator n=1 Tax=Macrococcus equi TaxID=3395462 RepID=UPI0039BE9FBE
MLIEHTDLEIIRMLKQDSRLTNKEIGEKVHMSGQAVGNRINHLIERGDVSQITIKKGYEDTQYIRVFLNGSFYSQIESLVMEYDEIEEFQKVSARARYILKSHFDKDGLKEFIQLLSKYSRYTVEVVI